MEWTLCFTGILIGAKGAILENSGFSGRLDVLGRNLRSASPGIHFEARTEIHTFAEWGDVYPLWLEIQFLSSTTTL